MTTPKSFSDTGSAYDQLVNNSGDYTAQVMADDPAVWLKCDDTIGSTSLVDSSGNGRDATFFNGSPTLGGPSAARMITGASVDFNGSSVVADGGPTYLDSLSSISVECWVKTTSSVNGSVLVAHYDGNAFSQQQFRLYYVVGIIRWNVWTASNATQDIQANVSVNDGVWHHVLATYSSSTGDMRIYIDGELASTPQALSASNKALHTATTTGLTVGGIFTTSTGYTQKFTGSIDEVAIYPRALTPDRVFDHFATGALAPRKIGTTSTTATASSVSLALTFSQVATAGHLLTAMTWTERGGSADPVVNTPSGWTLAGSYVPGQDDPFNERYAVHVFTKVAAGGETGVTITNTADNAVAFGDEWSNVTPAVHGVSPGTFFYGGTSTFSDTFASGQVQLGDLVLELHGALYSSGAATPTWYVQQTDQVDVSAAGQVQVSRTKGYGYGGSARLTQSYWTNAGAIAATVGFGVSFAGLGYPSLAETAAAADDLTLSSITLPLDEFVTVDDTFRHAIPGGPLELAELADILGAAEVEIALLLDGNPVVVLELVDGASDVEVATVGPVYLALDPVDGLSYVATDYRAQLYTDLDAVEGASVVYANLPIDGTTSEELIDDYRVNGPIEVGMSLAGRLTVEAPVDVE